MLLKKTILYKKPSKDSIKIFLRLHNGNGCIINTSIQETVEELLEHRQLRALQLPKSFELIYQGKNLTFYRSKLRELGVKDGAIIHIETKEEFSKKQLMIDLAIFLNNEKIYVRMKKDDTIQQLKRKIARITKIQAKNQKLYFRGEDLSDQNSIIFYHIFNDSLLYLKTCEQKYQHPDLIIPGVSISEETFQNNNSVTLSKKQISGPAQFKLFRSQRKFQSYQCFQINIALRQKEQAQQNLILQRNFVYNFFPQLPQLNEKQNDKLLSTQSHQYFDFNADTNIFNESQDLNFSGRLMIL